MDKNIGLDEKLKKFGFNFRIVNENYYINVKDGSKELPKILDLIKRIKLKPKSINIRKQHKKTKIR